MRFAVTSEQRFFFLKNHYLELEELLSEEQVRALSEKLNHILQKRAPKKTAWEYFMFGRDMWRSSEDVKQISLNPKFAEIVFFLTQQKPLRIAYDQCIKTPSHQETDNLILKYFHLPVSLKQISCLQPIICGLFLSLSPIKTSTPFPHNPGNGTFFSPELPLNFSPIFACKNQLHLLIAYSGEKTLYVLEPKDVHTHELKKMGYAFGDKLQNASHPIIFK